MANISIPIPAMDLRRLLALAALFVIGGIGASMTSSKLSADVPHECQDDGCRRFLWIDWCSGNAGEGTYCDLDNEDHDCLTTACGHH